MQTLEINELFAQYLPKLDYGQEKQLEQRMREDLTTEPILWWANPERDGRHEILDGHHRYAIARRIGVEPVFHEKHFDTEAEALLFLIRTQTTRRNLDAGRRQVLIQWCVDAEIQKGKSKTAAVEEAALLTNVSRRQVWRDVQEKSAQEQYREAKAKFEVQTTKSQVKQAEELKQRARREGWAEDTDRLEDEWQQLNQDVLADETEAKAELEQLAENAAQERAENPRRRTGKRKTKKSVLAASNRRNALKKATSAIEKVNSPLKEIDVFIPELKTGDMRKALETFLEQIQALQVVDAKKAKKKRFGR